MQTARVIGNTHATVRHSSLDGWRLLVVQPLDINNAADGFPLLVIDDLGAGRGDLVFFTSDGSAVRALVGRKDCLVRFAVQGILDAQ
jgi:ethanolamine utilization protein EutN